MTVFSGGVKTLIVEADEAKAERYARTLDLFPDNVNVRAKTPAEAIETLQKDNAIQQVLIDGRAWSVSQALRMLS